MASLGAFHWNGKGHPPDDFEGYDQPFQLPIAIAQRIRYSGVGSEIIAKEVIGSIVDYGHDEYGDFLKVNWDDGVKQRVHLPMAKEFSII